MKGYTPQQAGQTSAERGIEMKNLKLKYVNKESKFIEIGCGNINCRLHYRDEGSGPVLLLLARCMRLFAYLGRLGRGVETVFPHYSL